MNKPYDVFISYRREGGQATALLLYETLLRAGYRVAYDLETLRSGPFPEALYQIIENCKDVVVVLNPGALDRCVNEDDWLRKEVACAIRAKRNIVPILLRNFEFPASFDAYPDIAPLAVQHGVEASMAHFNDTILKIRRLLLARPRRWSRLLGFAGLTAAIAATGIILAMHFLAPRPSSTPEPGSSLSFLETAAGRQALESAIGVSSRLSVVENGIISAQQSFFQHALDNLGDIPGIEKQAAKMEQTLDGLEKQLRDTRPTESTISTLRGTPFSLEAFQSLGDIPRQDIQMARRLVTSLSNKLRLFSNGDDKREYCLACQDLVRGEADLFASVVMELMLPVPDDAPNFRDFRILLAKATAIARFGTPWARTQEDVDIAMEAAMSLQETAVDRLELLVGNAKHDLDAASRRISPPAP